MRVLVVDDMVAVRARIVALLLEAGLEVVAEAADAAGAVAAARRHCPDAIVLDLQLPDRHGLEILPELKRVIPSPRIAILTNSTQAAYEARARQLGADLFFDKSKDFDRVAEALARD